jgi:very-short-patch-repair endonuclease
MLATDLELFHHAIKLANSGQKTNAYQQLIALYRVNNNQYDASLALWIAFTSPNLNEAEQAINWAASLAPNDPNVTSARNWLAGQKTQQSHSPTVPNLQQALLDFKRDFAYYCQDGIITQEEWATLVRSAANNGLGLEQALAYIRPEATNFISQTIDLAAEDGFISLEEERNVNELIKLLALPAELAAPLQQRLSWLKTLTQIRQGELPSITPQIALAAGEIAHFEIKAAVEGQDKTPGWLVATNRRLVYSGPAARFKTNLADIRGVQATSNRLELQLEGAKASPSFSISDAPMVKAALEALVKLSQREALAENFKKTAQAKANPPKAPDKKGQNRNQGPSPIEKIFLETWELYNQHQALAISLVPEYKVFHGRYSLDFAHPASKTAIELDGYQAHSSTEQIASDRRREREVRKAGWEFIRFGGKEINQNVYGCVAETYNFIYKRITAAETAEGATSNTAFIENGVYKPARIKLLFIEEFSLNKGGKSFYSANSILFFRTREVFAEFFKTEWKTPDAFLKFFAEQGCYLTALGNEASEEQNPEADHKQRDEAVTALAQRLSKDKPGSIAVVMGGLKYYVKKALDESGVQNTPIEVLPFPGKDYEAIYKERLVKLLEKIKA